jgi:NAD(P)H-dependent FMN reductase
MQRKIELALIYGSTRKGRFCDTMARWAAAQIENQGAFALDVIDPAAPDLAFNGEHHGGAGRLALRRRIGRADAFVVITPEYNHSYPAALKALIDSVHEEWQAKPVAFVSYGGISGGIRAVEHLRHVFAELHAVGIRDSVSFANAWRQFDTEGALRDPEPANKAMATMLGRLVWWAEALRNAREARAYTAAAA